jgi:hypothetical protein
MIYRVHFYDDAEGSAGFAFVSSRHEAERRRRSWMAENPDTRSSTVMNSIDSAATPHTRADVIALLRRWGSHEQNG